MRTRFVFAATISAAASPPGPPPIIIKSYFSDINTPLYFFLLHLREGTKGRGIFSLFTLPESLPSREGRKKLLSLPDLIR
jgi:hypothetical protein